MHVSRLVLLTVVILVGIATAAVSSPIVPANTHPANGFTQAEAGHFAVGGRQPLFLQFNACGADCEGTSAQKTAALAAKLVRREPVAVSLNEICRPQLRSLRARLRHRGHPMHARFVGTIDVTWGQCLGQREGNAVLSLAKPRHTKRLTFSSQGSGPEQQAILCVKQRLAHPTQVCSTHLISGSDEAGVRNAQAGEVRSLVDKYKVPVVLMGDFNTVPEARSLDLIYSHRVYGPPAENRFVEADSRQNGVTCRCGEATQGSAKVDFVFWPHADFSRAYADAVHTRFSDHKLLWAAPLWK
jgi:endonuclease/exonuclease/phosphatase family metal-dependent hydrolase